MLAVCQAGVLPTFYSMIFSTVQVAAKTGTAQTGRAGDNPLKEFHGVFVAFAPFDDPKLPLPG